jgi:hypothetical protein
MVSCSPRYFTADVNILTVPAVGWEGAAPAALASVGCQALLVLLGPALAVPVALAALERLAETYEDSLALSMLCTTSVEAAWTGSMDEDELFNWCIGPRDRAPVVLLSTTEQPKLRGGFQITSSNTYHLVPTFSPPGAQ